MPEEASTGQALIRQHDQFFKQVLDQPGNADAFLRERLPTAIVAALGSGPPVDRSESFVRSDLGERRCDRIYALELADGTPLLVWIMVEHKSRPDPAALVQMLTNLCGIAERGAVRRRTTDGTAVLVPAPVVPILLYHGTRRWTLPTALADAYGLPDAVGTEYLLSLRYVLVDLATIPDADLSRHPDLHAGLLVLKHATRDDDPLTTLDRLLEAAAAAGLTVAVIAVRYLLGAGEPIDKARLLQVLKRVLPDQEDAMLSIAAREIIAETRAKIILEEMPQWKAEGKAEGKAELVLRLCRRRFGDLPAAVVAKVRTASEDRLGEIAERLLDAATLDEVLAATGRRD